MEILAQIGGPSLFGSKTFEETFSLVAVFLIGFSIVLTVKQVCDIRSVVRFVWFAVFMLVLYQLIELSGTVDQFDRVPVIGRQGVFHLAAGPITLLASIGFSFTGFYLALSSVGQLHREASEKGISLAREIARREHMEDELEERAVVLERLATGAALRDVLEEIASWVERHNTGMRCSILLVDVDGACLREGAAPSLPDWYNEAIDGIAIGADQGCCGSAAYHGRRVVASDVRTSPLWMPFLELAERADIRACWSQPIIGTEGKTVGTFAMYYAETREPDEADLDTIRSAAHLAGIAIEHTRTADALQESEAQFRSLFEGSPIAMLEDDFSKPKAQIDELMRGGVGDLRAYFSAHPEIVRELMLDVWVSSANRALFDLFRVSDFGQMLRHFGQMIRDTDVGTCTDILVSLAEGRQSTERRWDMYDANGDPLNTMVRFSVPEGAGPSWDRIIVTMVDITAAEQAQIALRDSEERFSQFMRHLPGLAHMKNARQEFIYVNEGFEKRFDRPRDEWIGKTVHDFSEGDEAQQLAENDTWVLENEETLEVIQDLEMAEGLHHYLTYKFPIKRPGKETLLGSVSIDITDSRRMEAGLRAVVEGTSGHVGEDFFLSLAKHLSEATGCAFGFVSEFPDGQLDRARLVAGWGNGAHVPLMEYEVADTPCALVVRNQTYSQESGVTDTFAKDGWLRKQGIESYLGIQLRDSQQRCIGMLEVLHTEPMAFLEVNESIISIFANRAGAELERLRAEEERRRIEQQLQQSQKLESLGVLAGGIAHDFNNLLVAILGNADLALDELPRHSPARECLKEIGTASKRAAELCRQMLAYSGKGQFVIETIPLNELVEEMVHLLRVSISKKCNLKLDFGDSLARIEGDATQIRQVIMNLITNASEAIGEETGVISLTTGHRYCDEAYLRDARVGTACTPGDYVYLEVVDTGAGMDEPTMNKLFDPFFTTKFMGRGLGMAAVMGIVRGHRAALMLASTEGRGTVFTLLFPAAVESRGESHEGAKALDGWRGSGRVLVVDDEPPVLAVATRMLKRAGFDVITAENGRVALDVFATSDVPVCCVILDLSMPEMDGVETLRALREMNADIPAIYSSGYSEQDAMDRPDGISADGFVQKPYESHDLIAQVRAALDAHEGDS